MRAWRIGRKFKESITRTSTIPRATGYKFAFPSYNQLRIPIQPFALPLRAPSSPMKITLTVPPRPLSAASINPHRLPSQSAIQDSLSILLPVPLPNRPQKLYTTTPISHPRQPKHPSPSLSSLTPHPAPSPPPSHPLHPHFNLQSSIFPPQTPLPPTPTPKTSPPKPHSTTIHSFNFKILIFFPNPTNDPDESPTLPYPIFS